MSIGTSGRTVAARQRWIALLARSSAAELRALLARCPPLPEHTVLRPAEDGSVMVQGRTGGGGGAFNLGEASVTRCAVRCGDAVGHAYVLGRDAEHALLAARLDAALQDETLRPPLEQHLLAALEQGQAERARHRAARAAGTGVEFFTLATMRS